MSRSKEEWIQLGVRRLNSILAIRLCCPHRMLEAKICEAGPGDKRPNPVSLNAALQRLVSAHKIQIIPKRTANESPFYASTYVDITTEAFQGGIRQTPSPLPYSQGPRRPKRILQRYP